MGWQPPEKEWRDLIEALSKLEHWDDAVLVMRDYVRDVPRPSPRLLLKLAQILIRKQGRPQQGLKVLAQVPAGSLPQDLETIRVQLVRRAEVMRDEGPLELDEDLV
jgi:hypothetical protein